MQRNDNNANPQGNIVFVIKLPVQTVISSNNHMGAGAWT